MTESEKVDRIERDRQQDERDLKKLLLALLIDFQDDMSVDLRSGIGSQFVDMHIQRFQARAANEIALSMADSHRTAFMRAGKLTGQDIGRADAGPIADLAKQYQPQADEAAQAMADSIRESLVQTRADVAQARAAVGAGVATVEQEALAKLGINRVIKLSFDRAGYTAAHPQAIDVGVARQIVSASNSGMIHAINSLPIALGIRHISILDSVTTPICRARHGYTLPADDPYWLTNTPPLHWNAIARGTLVRTFGGILPIEYVGPALFVWTHRSRWRKVYAVMSKRHESTRIRELHLDTGRILRITDEHPVLVSVGWKPAGNLKVGDVLFQYSHQMKRLSKARLCDPKDFPSLADEENISFPVCSVSTSRSMTFPINFNRHFFGRKSEVCHVFPNGKLEDECDAGRGQYSKQNGLRFGRRFSIGSRNADRSSLCCAGGQDGVSAAHIRGMGSISGAGVLGSSPSPMSRARRMSTRRISDLSLCDSVSDCDAVALAPSTKGRLPKSQASLYGTDRFIIAEMSIGNDVADDVSVGKVDSWHGATIVSIADVAYNGEVFNLAVEEDETYLANDVIVHNCRSALVPVSPQAEQSERRILPPPAPGFGQGLLPAFAAGSGARSWG